MRRATTTVTNADTLADLDDTRQPVELLTRAGAN